jgi:hypothetical protein
MFGVLVVILRPDHIEANSDSFVEIRFGQFRQCSPCLFVVS